MEAALPRRFSRTRYRPGYSIAEVEALIERIEATLGLRPRYGPPVRAADVAAAQFRLVRLRPGYEMREVDEALDQYEQLLQEQGWQ
jgi:DivIVA domain-containing protein